LSEDLQARITLDSRQFSLGVGEIVSKLSTLEAATAKMGASLENNLGRSLGQVNKSLQGLSLDSVVDKLAATGDKLKAAFGDVVQPAIDFQAAMANVNTVAKLSDTELAALRDQMRTLSTTIGIGIPPAEAAAATYDILSAGFTKTADATEILQQAAIASEGGLTSTAAAADLLTSALNSYGAGADQAKKFNDALFIGVEKGKIRFEDFVQGLGQVAPAAAANGVSIEELSSAMAALTAAGQQPARAFTGLNAAIVQLSSPTKEASDAALALGIDLNGAAFRGLSLVEKLQLLAQTAGENKSALRKVLGDVNALGVAYSLTGNGAKTYADALTASTGPNDAAADAAERNGKSVKAAQDRFAAAAAALKIAVSEGILPVLSGLAEGGVAVIKFLDSFSPAAKTAAGAAAALGTAATIAAGFFGGLAIFVRQVALALGVELPTAAAAGTGAMARLSAAAAATRTAILGVNAAALVGPGILIALGAGAIKAALDFAKLQTAAAAAADAIESVGGKSLKGTTADVSTGTILSTPAQVLKKQGVTKEDVQNRIRELRETREDALASGDQALLKKLDEKIKLLIEKREQLGTAAEEAQKADVSDKVKNFKLQAPVDKGAIEERRKQALFEIETGLTGEQRIAALEAFIAREKLAGDERRAIEQKIFHEREKLQSDAAAKAKTLADDQKADALQEIDLSKASHQTKIAQLAALATKYKDDADLRRRINAEIAREEEAIAKDAADKKKKREDDAKKAQEAAKERTSEEQGARREAIDLRKDAIGGELDTAKEKGQTATVGALLQERQRLTEETIRLQLAEQLAQTQSAEARVQLERNAEERIRQEKKKTHDEFKAFTDKQIEDQKRLDEAKKPKGPSTEFTGQLLSVEDLAKQSEARFGSSSVNDDFAARQASTAAARVKKLQANLTGLGVTGTDFKNVAAKVGPVTSSPVPAKMALDLNITVTTPAGSETQRTTLPGVGPPGSGGGGSISFSPRGRA